ncbi:DEAD/DEAH box helicase [Marinilongibacter aquaticus]|uniref:DEAD/DEAH box helicase n=1 Tax=Marinilongibacter aquaticus TaxID=2975157 RepID=UPI0021BDA20A|nr:DEAD/DEAH box helicase [Marinilongibacter aquaticus]UBM60618.1 DEAD/DEAH box helicase [Marinilongibacter aquaticus]
MSFKALGLNEALLKAIEEKGYTTPSVIQEKAIPEILNGKDVLASAQTGTGKTAGFSLPLIQLLCEEEPSKRRPIKALVLTPTRELAAQVYAEMRSYSEHTGLRTAVIFGGVKQNPQVATLRQGVDILIATPGRLLDLQNQKLLHLTQVRYLILDEADRMLDMGFLRDIKKILALMPNRSQNLLFSATFSDPIKKLAASFMNKPVQVEAAPENSTAEKVQQKFYHVDKNQKTEAVIKLIWDNNWHQVLVFTRTKHGANRLAQKFAKQKITSAAIHGNKTQNARTKALDGFKKGEVSVLVATDIAARGLDIPLLPHVINFELPNVPEDYVHRIGRTGRAGASGEAISLVSADEFDYLHGIEKLLKENFEILHIPDFEPTEKPKAAPAKAPQNRQNQRRGQGPSAGNRRKDGKRRFVKRK